MRNRNKNQLKSRVVSLVVKRWPWGDMPLHYLESCWPTSISSNVNPVITFVDMDLAVHIMSYSEQQYLDTWCEMSHQKMVKAMHEEADVNFHFKLYGILFSNLQIWSLLCCSGLSTGFNLNTTVEGRMVTSVYVKSIHLSWCEVLRHHLCTTFLIKQMGIIYLKQLTGIVVLCFHDLVKTGYPYLLKRRW